MPDKILKATGYNRRTNSCCFNILIRQLFVKFSIYDTVLTNADMKLKF